MDNRATVRHLGEWILAWPILLDFTMTDNTSAGQGAGGAGAIDGNAMADALAALSAIQSVLGTDDAAPEKSEFSFELPLSDAIALIPQQYVKEYNPETATKDMVNVTVEDLFNQLKRGRVSVTMADFAYFLPSHMLSHEAFDDRETRINLPLAVVVQAINMDSLKKRTTQHVRRYQIDDLDDPFAKPAPKPAQVEQPPAESEAAPEASGPEAAEPEPAPEPEQAEAAEPLEPEPEAAPQPEAAPEVPEAEAAPTEPEAKEPEREEPEPVTEPQAAQPEEPAPTEEPAPQEAPEPAEPEPKAVEPAEAPTVHVMPPPAEEKAPQPEPVEAEAPPEPESEPAEPAPVEPAPVEPEAAEPEAAEPEAEEPEPVTEPEAAQPEEPAPPEEPVAEEPTAPTEPAPVEAVVPPPVPEPEPAGEPEPAAAPVAAAAAPVSAEGKYRELPGNVNLNSATPKQLMTLEGVTEQLAGKIVEAREQCGGFKNVFDLADIPRLGRRTFKQITGMSFSKRRHHRSHRLASLLHMHISDISDLPAVAEAVTRRPGLQGCLISGKDGLLIAQKGMDKEAEALSAIVPKIARQVAENMELVNENHLDSISICLKKMMYTIIPSQNVTLTVLHAAGRITKTQLAMLKKVTKELAWLLSHRGYVGPPN